MILYIIDILNYTIIDNIWGFGIENCKKCDKPIARISCSGYFISTKLIAEVDPLKENSKSLLTQSLNNLKCIVL